MTQPEETQTLREYIDNGRFTFEDGTCVDVRTEQHDLPYLRTFGAKKHDIDALVKLGCKLELYVRKENDQVTRLYLVAKQDGVEGVFPIDDLKLANTCEAIASHIRQEMEYTINPYAISAEEEKAEELSLEQAVFEELKSGGFPNGVINQKNFSGKNLSYIKSQPLTQILHSKLHDTILDNAEIAGASIIYCDLNHANVKGADLRNVDFSYSDLKDLQFDNTTQVAGADFSRAYNVPVALRELQKKQEDLEQTRRR